MATQPDPRYFGVGNAFLGGIEMAGQEQRRNALLENDARMVNLQEQQFAADQQMMQGQARQQQAAAQSAELEKYIGLKSLAASRGDAQAAAEVTEMLGLDPNDQDAPELFGVLAEKYGGFKLSGSGKADEPYTLAPGSKRFGPDGRVIAEVPPTPPNQTVIQLPSGQALLNPRTGKYELLSDRADQRGADAADAGAIEKAKADAQAEADAKKKAKADSAALAGWDAGLANLAQSLGGTTTGPIQGRLPALTANQQVADASVAALAPVLKAIFRSAGEGTFTDRDQQMLLDMIPGRTTHPEAAAAIIKNIDTIVRAKLGSGQSAGTDSDPLGIRQ